MTIHEINTHLAPGDVIERARSFFALDGTPHAAFPLQSGDDYLVLHMEVGEIVIGTIERDGTTCVRGSASRGAHLLTRFLTTLAPPLDIVQTTRRYRRNQAPPPAAEASAERNAQQAGVAGEPPVRRIDQAA